MRRFNAFACACVRQAALTPPVEDPGVPQVLKQQLVPAERFETEVEVLSDGAVLVKPLVVVLRNENGRSTVRSIGRGVRA